MDQGDTTLGGPPKGFHTTLKELVSRAGGGSTTTRQAALQDLCGLYWKPIYRTVRIVWAKSNEDAKDLTQAFFLWLMEDGSLKEYDPEKGRFRSFLKGLLKNFVRHQQEALDRLKRGGGKFFLALDAPEAGYLEDALSDGGSTEPGEVFDRAWRVALLKEAIERVRASCGSGDRALKFRAFEEYDLSSSPASVTYKAVADRLGLKESDVQNYLAAIREEVRAEVRSELSRRSENPRALEEEWNEFLGS